METSKSWYNKTGLLALALIFLPPLGIYGLWVSQTKQGWKIFWTVIILFVGFGQVMRIINKPTVPQSVNTPKEQTKSFSAYKITLEEFNSVPVGSTYEEAVKIIGEEGELMSEGEIAGYSNKIYMWQNFDGTNANFSFQNGKLISKAQFKLPN